MTAAAAPNLGHLPEWNLADLYASPEAPEFAADMKKGEELAKAFAGRYRGKLASLDGAALAQVRTARELLVFLLSLQFRFEERRAVLRELRQGGLLEPLLTKQLYFPSLLAWRTPQQNERL